MKNEIHFQIFKRYKLILILLIFITACGKKESGNNAFTHAASFEKLDSVAVPFRGKFTVHDLDPISKTILFVSHEEQPKMVLADFDGQIRASFSSKEGLTDGYGSLLAPLKIVGKDSILAYGSNGFLTFDFSGKIQSKVGHSKANLPGIEKMAMGEGMEKMGNKYLYINQGFGNLDQRGLNLRQKQRLLVWLDPKMGDKELFLDFPENSIFRPGTFFFKDAWKPVFMIVDDLIFVVFGIEPVIYVYKTSAPYALVSRIPFDLPEYRYFKGADANSSSLNFFELPFTSGKILNIKWVDGYFVTAYFPGLDALDSRKYAGKSTQEFIDFNREMRKKYPNRIAIIDSVGNVINDFVPEGLEPKSMLVRNGELWMMEKPDEEAEQDYFRLFRVGLKIEE